MALATVDESGHPDVRTVLLKDCENGFVFYTNLESVKASQLLASHEAALCFFWPELKKQVRVRGYVEIVSDEVADAYFASRPRTSQLGAWASKQSHTLEGRFELEKRVAIYAAKFGTGPIPRPPFWSGFRLYPRSIEFWLQEPFRLHRRLLYSRNATGWDRRFLFP